MDQVVKAHRAQSGLMRGVCKSGFGLLELLLVIIIVALVGTAVVPLLRPDNPQRARKELVSILNELATCAQQQAIVTGKKQRVEFDFAAHTIAVLTESETKDGQGKLVFVPVARVAMRSSAKVAPRFVVRQFLVEGFDEISRYTGGSSAARAWFYVLPTGTAQAVVINYVDTRDKIASGQGKPLSLVLNPFSVQFKEYDAFQQ